MDTLATGWDKDFELKALWNRAHWRAFADTWKIIKLCSEILEPGVHLLRPPNIWEAKKQPATEEILEPSVNIHQSPTSSQIFGTLRGMAIFRDELKTSCGRNFAPLIGANMFPQPVTKTYYMLQETSH